MLTPTKHTNIKYSVIHIAGKVLAYLKRETVLKYDDIRDLLVSEIGQKSKHNMDFSLTFLYSIGKIEYLENIDAIALIKGKDED